MVGQNETSHKFLPYAFAVLLAVAVLAGYLNTLYSPFVLDDESNILRNNSIQIQDFGAASLRKIFSGFSTSAQRPVANLSFALNYLAGGFDTTGYHVVNIFIHLMTSLVVFRLFVWYVRKTKTLAGDSAIQLAGVAALLWAANPIQTNAVTYIVQRMTSLCAFFFLASLLVYLFARDRSAGVSRGGSAGKACLFLAAFLLWVLALLTKENAAIMPAVLLLHEVFFFDRLSLARIAEKKYYYLAALAIPCFALWLYLGTGGWRAILNAYGERDFTMTERLLTQPRVVLRYMSIFLLPLPSRMTLFYEYPISRSLFAPLPTLFSILTITAFLGGSCLLARKNPLIAFGILWTLLCLLIESSVVPLELIFEHRFYLPSVGFSLAVTVAMTGIFSRFALAREVVNVFWICLIALLVTLTAMRNSDWRDSTSIYLDGVRKAPHSLRALTGLGVTYLREKKDDQGVQALQQALAIDPRNVVPLANLFLCYSDSFRYQEAEPYLDRIKMSIREEYFRCSDAGNISLMSEELVRRARFVDVVILLEGLARCGNARTPVYFDNLGLSYAKLGQHGKAVENFRKALALDPQNPYILLSLARSYLVLGDKSNAALLMNKLQGLALPEELRPQLEKLAKHLSGH